MDQMGAAMGSIFNIFSLKSSRTVFHDHLASRTLSAGAQATRTIDPGERLAETLGEGLVVVGSLWIFMDLRRYTHLKPLNHAP